ncbi:MAG TPA: toxin HicA [Lachnospiraceae bacterium]|nr:toxin HicA [Lachnospiraceae bacterium]
MAADEKLYMAIMRGMQDNNIKFRELQRLLDALGFDHRIKGDHFIYYYGNLPENINIQPNGSMAKPYQVKQVRNYLLKYGIEL